MIETHMRDRRVRTAFRVHKEAKLELLSWRREGGEERSNNKLRDKTQI